MKAWCARLRPFLVLLTLGLGACGIARVFSRSEGPQRLFSHKLHVKGQDLACKNCHPKAEKEDVAGMPASLKKCMMCHETEDEKKPEDRKLQALLGETPAWSNFTEAGEDIKFSHRRHVTDGKLECSQCHPGMDENESVSEALRPSMKACMDCHASRGQSNDCLSCHRTMNLDTSPASHRLNWKQAHGAVMREQDHKRLDGNCALCHQETSCDACHAVEAPRNHTNHWRLRGHRLSAEADRSSCATCHQEDSCNRCHGETEPRSHTAAWAGGSNRHCVSCHVGEEGPQGCATCHDGASHRTAPPMPANNQHARVTEEDCRRCHNVIGLPHLDNGDNCGSCH